MRRDLTSQFLWVIARVVSDNFTFTLSNMAAPHDSSYSTQMLWIAPLPTKKPSWQRVFGAACTKPRKEKRRIPRHLRARLTYHQLMWEAGFLRTSAPWALYPLLAPSRGRPCQLSGELVQQQVCCGSSTLKGLGIALRTQRVRVSRCLEPKQRRIIT